jgi:hypothetical protein
VYIHPELGLRLAQAKIEEARSLAQRESALRAASLDRRVARVAVDTRRDRWVARGARYRTGRPGKPKPLP